MLTRLDDDERSRLRAELSRRLARYATDAGVSLPAQSLVASARVGPPPA